MSDLLRRRAMMAKEDDANGLADFYFPSDKSGFDGHVEVNSGEILYYPSFYQTTIYFPLKKPIYVSSGDVFVTYLKTNQIRFETICLCENNTGGGIRHLLVNNQHGAQLTKGKESVSTKDFTARYISLRIANSNVTTLETRILTLVMNGKTVIGA